MNRRYLAAPYLVWVIGFILLPLVMVLAYAVTDGSGQFTLVNVLAIFNPIHLRAFFYSVVIALLTTVVCLIIAYPLAYILSTFKPKISSLLIMIFVIPMWINFLLRILALQMILSNTGVINALLGFFGAGPLHIMYTKIAIVIGMVYDYIPFMILPIYNAMMKIDQSVIEAAQDLGADTRVTFQRVIIPLSLPGVISGIVMVLIPSISEFVVADILGGSKTLLLGNVIDQEFNVANNWNLGSGLSIVLMIFIFVSMAIMNRTEAEEGDLTIW